MSFVIMSNRAYRFPNPTASLAPTNPDKQKPTQNFNEAFAEVHPAPGGAWGNPTTVPDWVKQDGMFVLALRDKNIVVLQGLEVAQTDEERAAEAAKQATLQAAGKAATQISPNLPASTTDLSAAGDAAPDLEAMTKKELVEHASEVHGLALDGTAKKDELIAQIQEAAGKKE